MDCVKIKAGEAGNLLSFAPIYDKNSKILLLGTMPSPASLKAGMYYSHPNNNFWRILALLTNDSCGTTNEEKKRFLLRNRIAVWDTLKSCTRPGASDSQIKNAAANDIASLIVKAPLITAVFLNGSAAYRYYVRYQSAGISLPFFRLPSTSPANCGVTFAEKLESWGKIKDYLV